MEKRNLMNELNMKLSDALKKKRIKMFDGRPFRDLTISQDDIVNLKIALNHCKSLEEFLNKV